MVSLCRKPPSGGAGGPEAAQQLAQVPKVLHLVQTGRESSAFSVWELQLKAAQATGGSRAVADSSTLSPVAAEMEKVPPQQHVQGQRLIELKPDLLHHLQVSASGGKNQQHNHSNK